MPSFIIISEKRSSQFGKDAKTVLASHRFTELHANTYVGQG